MNAVAGHLRLAGPLILGGAWLQILLMLVFGALLATTAWGGSDTWLTFLTFGFIALGLILGYRPEPIRYRALNLSGGLYRTHFIIGLTLLLLIVAACLTPVLARTEHARWWVLAGLVLTLYGVQVVTKTTLPEPGRLPERARGSSVPAPQEVREDGPVIDDLETELIVRPQRGFWLSTWAGVIIFSATWLLLTWLWGDGGTNISAALITAIVCALITTGVSGAVSSNLSHWVSLGGSRVRWAKKTRLVMLINPVVGALVLAMVTAWGGRGAVIAAGSIAAIALLVPVLVVLTQLATRGTATYLVAAVAVTGAGVSSLIAGQAWGLLVAGAVCFVGFEILLPRIARAYNPFTGGLRAFLGMQRQAG